MCTGEGPDGEKDEKHEFRKESNMMLDLISANPKAISDELLSQRVGEFLGRFSGEGWAAIEDVLREKRPSVFSGFSTD